MRRVSKTNSHYWINDAVSNRYRDENPCDEIAYLFPEYDRAFSRVPCKPTPTLISKRDQPACHLHHICRRIGGTPRWDIVTNLISLSQFTHAFCHGDTAFDGLILCLAAKKAKGELDWSELDRITHLNMRGYLETRELKCEWVRPLLASILEERRAA